MNKCRIYMPFYILMALWVTLLIWVFLPFLGIKGGSLTEITGSVIFTIFFWFVALAWSLFCDHKEEAERRSKMFLSRV